jgi:hypothetical protein
VEVRLAPAQRIETRQHVVGDLHVHRAQLEEVEGEGLAVVGRGEELRNARDLPAVATLGQVEKPRARLRSGTLREAGAFIPLARWRSISSKLT